MLRETVLIIMFLDDINNQGAAQLARQVDPAGERTIGTAPLFALNLFFMIVTSQYYI